MQFLQHIHDMGTDVVPEVIVVDDDTEDVVNCGGIVNPGGRVPGGRVSPGGSVSQGGSCLFLRTPPQ